MNDKEKTIYQVLDIVVDCCSMDIDGRPSVSAEDVLGKSRQSNIVLTRCIFITQMLFLGYTTATIALLLHRSETAIRHLLEVAHQSRLTSKAYRLAEAEATLRCKNIKE